MVMMFSFDDVGPGEQCTGETKLTMDDIKNYYTEKAFLSTGVIPVVAPRDCAPGLKCTDTKCSSCKYQ